MRSDPRRDTGMVTAELAVCLPVLLLLAALSFALVEVGAAQVRALDAAREAATSVARGDSGAARRLVGVDAPGARLDVVTKSGDVRATVTQRVALLGSALPPVVITESAVAALEPTVSP